MAIRGRFSDCLIQKIEPISELSPDLYINFNNYKMALGWNGATLEEAVEYACNLAPNNSGLNTAVICGDRTVTFH